jgi:hypothetical protein
MDNSSAKKDFDPEEGLKELDAKIMRINLSGNLLINLLVMKITQKKCLFNNY